MGDDKNKDLWVLMETKEDGSVRSSSLELMNPGIEIARKKNGRMIAIVLSADVDKAVKQIERYGADEIIVVQGEVYKEYTTEIYAETLCHLIEKYKPMGLLIAATNNGRDIAPRIACRLKTGLTADCTSVDIDEETGCLLWTRPTLGGNLMASILCQNHWPQMGTIRPGTYKMKECLKKDTKIKKENVILKQDINKIKVYETLYEDKIEVDFENAEIIVAGGKGMGSSEGFQMLNELADALGGMVGATRGAVEQGWISHAHQIGQTGRMVSPKLYIACGISGAVQHIVGMSSANIIIAINQDSSAPIFQVADYGIVGDVQKIIPELIKKVEERKSAKNKSILGKK